MAWAGGALLRSAHAGHAEDADRRRQRLPLRVRALDLADDVHAADHAAERGVAGTQRAAGVEKTVVADADEELRRGGVRVGRARHRDDAVRVVQAGLARRL